MVVGSASTALSTLSNLYQPGCIWQVHPPPIHVQAVLAMMYLTSTVPQSTFKLYQLRCILQHSLNPHPGCYSDSGLASTVSYCVQLSMVVGSASTALSTLSNLYQPGCILQVQP